VLKETVPSALHCCDVLYNGLEFEEVVMQGEKAVKYLSE